MPTGLRQGAPGPLRFLQVVSSRCLDGGVGTCLADRNGRQGRGPERVVSLPHKGDRARGGSRPSAHSLHPCDVTEPRLPLCARGTAVRPQRPAGGPGEKSVDAPSGQVRPPLQPVVGRKLQLRDAAAE